MVVGLTIFLRQWDKVHLLALLRPCDVCWQIWVELCLEVHSPPCTTSLANLPFCTIRSGRAIRFEELVQYALESLDLVLFGLEPSSWPVHIVSVVLVPQEVQIRTACGRSSQSVGEGRVDGCSRGIASHLRRIVACHDSRSVSLDVSGVPPLTRPPPAVPTLC